MMWFPASNCIPKFTQLFSCWKKVHLKNSKQKSDLPWPTKKNRMHTLVLYLYLSLKIWMISLEIYLTIMTFMAKMRGEFLTFPPFTSSIFSTPKKSMHGNENLIAPPHPHRGGESRRGRWGDATSCTTWSWWQPRNPGSTHQLRLVNILSIIYRGFKHVRWFAGFLRK